MQDKGLYVTSYLQEGCSVVNNMGKDNHFGRQRFKQGNMHKVAESKAPNKGSKVW